MRTTTATAKQAHLDRIRAAHDAISDADDIELQRASATDPDSLPGSRGARCGRPPAAVTKEKVMLRLDPEVIAAFKADGDGWQTRMNLALRKAAGLK